VDSVGCVPGFHKCSIVQWLGQVHCGQCSERRAPYIWHPTNPLSSFRLEYSFPPEMSVSRPPQCAPPPPPPPYNPNRSRYNSTGEHRQRTSRSQTPGPTPSRPVALPPLRVVNLSTPLQETPPSLSMIAGETAQRYRHRSLQRSSRIVPEFQDRLTPPLSSSPSPSSSSSPPSSPPSSSSSSSYSGTVTATPSHAHLSSHLTGPPSDPLPPAPPNSQILKNRSKFHPLAVLKLSKSARHPIPPRAVDLVAPQTFDQIRPQTAEETARYAAQQREIEEAARRESARAGAKDNVRSLVECLLSGRLPPDEERSSIFAACAQACELGGLDLSTVLQEMAIEGYPPIYWAIVNRAAASGNNNVELDSLVFALLDACRPLSPATLDAILLACMTASDNVLLQRLFRDIPPLSPLSARDVLLLGPANLEDHVDVDEKRDGTGSFVAHIKIPRFRLRMRVCKSVAVEFVASCACASFPCVSRDLRFYAISHRQALDTQI
jgi:hypothetical protein